MKSWSTICAKALFSGPLGRSDNAGVDVETVAKIEQNVDKSSNNSASG